MKAYIIKASAPGPYKKYKQQRGGPPQNIFSLDAATPENIAIEMTDETAGMRVNANSDADLVALLMSTPDALRAYDLADEFKRRGKSIVFGGLHPTFMPDEALKHGDAVIIGETEGVWPELIADFSSGALKRQYRRDMPVDMAGLRPYPTRHIRPETYGGFWSVLVSRGCPFKCSFCLVNRFFDRIHYRPVQDVVDEIRHCGTQWIELHADNLTYNREYAMELFTAIKPLKINWAGETTIRISKDDELLSLAAEIGLRYLLVGLETPSQSALKSMSKGFVKPEEAREYVAKLHEHRIIVDASMLFGFDEHDKNIFAEALDFVDYVGVDVCDGIIVIPFPGSRMFKKLNSEGRILTRDWSKYDGTHAVFQPAQMSPKELEEGQNRFWYKYHSLVRILSRKRRQAKNVGVINAMYLAFQ